VIATPGNAADPDSVQVEALAPWFWAAHDPRSGEHVVLSDGYRHIRLDIAEGSLAAGHPVRLHYQLSGVSIVEPKLLPLRRLLHLCQRGRFARSLFPPDPKIERWLMALRVHDGLLAGASQREIAAVLFGAERVDCDWAGASDSLRTRVRRLVREARALVAGGYRLLLRRSGKDGDGDRRCGD
jgi:hypothetical protein